LYHQETDNFVASRILTASGNKITANDAFGLMTTDTATRSILNADKNYIVGNNAHGIFFESGQGFFMDKNTVGLNNGDGIISSPLSPATLNKNYVYGNSSAGVAVGRWSVIYSNRLYSNGGTGLILSDSSHVQKNTVMNNFGNGIDGSASLDSLIENCKAYGNGDGMVTFDLYDPSFFFDVNAWLNNKYGTLGP